MAEKPWWKHGTSSLHIQLNAVVTRLQEDDTSRRDRHEKYLRLYGGVNVAGTLPWNYTSTRSATPATVRNDRLRLNVVKASIDTISAKVGKNRPRPTFLTSGGSHSQQRRAKKLQKFIDGAYHQADVYELAPQVFRDAMVFGTGVLHTYKNGTRLACERVFPLEILVDPIESLYGKPRSLYRIKYIDKDVLVGMFPKSRGAILRQTPENSASEGTTGAFSAENRPESRIIRVIEAWHLPSVGTSPANAVSVPSSSAAGIAVGGLDKSRVAAGPQNPDSKSSDPPKKLDGRRSIVIDGHTLLNEEWKYNDYPFTFLHWSKPMQGFWGDAATSEVVGVQVEINKLLQKVQRSMDLTANPWLMVEKGSTVSKGQISNATASRIDYTGTMPQVVTFQSINPQVLNHLWMLYSRAFEILGSNQLAASASAPPGLESGRALEKLSEEHSERFMTVSRHFEHMFGSRLPEQFIRLAKELDEESKAQGGKGFVIKSPQGKTLLKLPWEDVSIDNDDFIIQVFPTSSLPTNPALRTAEIERLMAAGIIDNTEGRRLLDFPDLDASTDLATAAEDDIHRQLENMLDEGMAQVPEPYQDLGKALKLAQSALLRANDMDTPERNKKLVRSYMKNVESLQERAAAEVARQTAQIQAQAQAQAPPAQQGGAQPPPPVLQ